MYLALLQITRHQWFPELKLEKDGGKYRTALLTFREKQNTPSTVTDIRTADELRNCLRISQAGNENTVEHPQGKVVGRLFLLEGLPGDFIHILGAHMRIAPDFFGRHAQSAHGSPTNNVMPAAPEFESAGGTCFTLEFFRTQKEAIERKHGDDNVVSYAVDHGYTRPLVSLGLCCKPQLPRVKFERISFWSSPLSTTDPWIGKCLPSHHCRFRLTSSLQH